MMNLDTSDQTSIDEALEDFRDGFNCSQAIVAAFSAQYGLSRETALRIASGFNGGVAGTGGPCGAVTGALMVIGLARGASTLHDGERRAAAKLVASDFCRSFREVHGSISCSDLMGVDMGTPAGRAHAAAQGLLRERCPKLVETAALILFKSLPR